MPRHYIRPYHWEVETPPKIKGGWGEANIYDEERIYVWSLDKDSKRVLTIIRGFQPCCYIDLGHGDKWKDYMIEDMMNSIYRKIPFISYKVIRRQTLNGGLSKKKLVRVKLPNQEAGRDLYYKLRENPNYQSGVFIDGKKHCFDVWGHDIESVRKLLSIKDIKYTDWLEINSELVDEADKVSTCEYEYIISWNDLKKIDQKPFDGLGSHPMMFSFDIETFNHQYKERPNKFPDKNLKPDVTNIISCGFKTYKKDDRKKYAIVLGECTSAIELKHADSEIINVKTESEVYKKMCELVHIYDPDIIMGYNIFNYDFDYISTRLKLLGEEYEPLSRLYDSDPSDVVDKYGKKRIYHPNWSGRAIVDMLLVCKGLYPWLDNHKLETIASMVLKKHKYDMPPEEMFASYDFILKESYECYQYLVDKGIIDADDNEKGIYPVFLKEKLSELDCEGKDEVKAIVERYKKALDRYSKFVDYCLQDSILVLEIFEFVSEWDDMLENATIQEINPIDCINTGAEHRSISNLYNECYKEGIIMDRNKLHQDYQPTGGFVFDPHKGIWDKVCILDFNSLYPNTIISHNLCYTTFVRPWDYRESLEPHINWYHTVDKKGNEYRFPFFKSSYKKGIIPALMTKFIEERKIIRAKIPLPEYKDIKVILNSRQNAMKICANSFYGFLGMGKGRYGCLPIAATICSIGQNSTKRMARYMEEKGYGKIVYGDTDSVMCSMKAKDPVEAKKLGDYCAREINGKVKKGELNVLTGKIVEEDIPALFSDYEKALQVDCERTAYGKFIVKKKYCLIEYGKDGEKRRDDKGNYVLYRKGLFSKRNDSCKYTAMIYDKSMIMSLDRERFIDVLKFIHKSIKDAMTLKISHKEFITSRKVGIKYNSENAAVKVFKERLFEDGIVIFPGERVSFVIVKLKDEPEKILKGLKYRMVNEFEKGDFKLDYEQYFINSLSNSLDDILRIGYKEDIEKLADIFCAKKCKSKGSIHSKIYLNSPTKFIYHMVANNQSMKDVFDVIENRLYK